MSIEGSSVQSPELAWFKSSYSGGAGGECVEIAAPRCGTVHVRDSKDKAGAVLTFAAEEWAAFVAFATQA